MLPIRSALRSSRSSQLLRSGVGAARAGSLATRTLSTSPSWLTDKRWVNQKALKDAQQGDKKLQGGKAKGKEVVRKEGTTADTRDGEAAEIEQTALSSEEAIPEENGVADEAEPETNQSADQSSSALAGEASSSRSKPLKKSINSAARETIRQRAPATTSSSSNSSSGPSPSAPSSSASTAGGGGGNSGGSGDDGSGKGSGSPPSPPKNSNELSKLTIPEEYPQVLALPITRRPLFPGKMIAHLPWSDRTMLTLSRPCSRLLQGGDHHFATGHQGHSNTLATRTTLHWCIPAQRFDL